jgi:hypothetical protein
MGLAGERMLEEAYQLYCKETENSVSLEEFFLSDELTTYFDKIRNKNAPVA